MFLDIEEYTIVTALNDLYKALQIDRHPSVMEAGRALSLHVRTD